MGKGSESGQALEMVYKLDAMACAIKRSNN